MNDKSLEQKIHNFLELIEQKRKECVEKGHQEVIYLPYTVSNKSNTLKDKVHGFCKYCYSPVSKSLNNSERESIRELYERSRELITI